MEDMLKELCAKAKLELVYTNNKITFLSSGTENNLPTIRAHKIFRNCSEEVANAVVNYYINHTRSEEYIKTIEEYIKKYCDIEQYRIKPPSELFKALVSQISADTKLVVEQEDNLVELSIQSIMRRTFSGDESAIDPNYPLKGSSDDPIELDIIVNPFNT